MGGAHGNSLSEGLKEGAWRDSGWINWPKT